MVPGITIRTPSRGEFDKIAACMAEARGERYYSAEYYDPGYLFGGGYELFAAYGGGEMMGVIGITHGVFDDNMATLTMLNIRKGFTGQGAAAMLLDHTVTLLRKRGVPALKGNAVTWHAAVQGVLERLGLRPTGLLHGVKNGQNLTPAVCGKCSLAVYTGNVSVRDAGTLYVHKAMAETIRRVYTDAGAAAVMLGDGSRGDATVLKHCYKAHDDVLYVQVLECGPDLPRRLGELYRRYAGAPAFTMTVMLNLCSPSAVYGADALCGAGFRFCGADPLGQYEHALFYRGDVDLAEAVKTKMLEEFCGEARLL